VQRVRRLVLIALIVSGTRTASAHPFEFGISIEPTFAGMPALADSGSVPSTAYTVGGGIGVEYMFVKYLAVTTRLAYTHAIGDSKIGQATFNTADGFPRTGDYFLTQDCAFGLAGLRLESPIWWIPVQFFVGAQGGAALFFQDNRELRNQAGIPYDISLPLVVKPAPLVALSGGIYGRVIPNPANTPFIGRM
jgi:hypothetical protein